MGGTGDHAKQNKPDPERQCACFFKGGVEERLKYKCDYLLTGRELVGRRE
jgi:hypothetical protein